jgi:FKBP-type peptidyl-prolyl cis-trans isomerase
MKYALAAAAVLSLFTLGACIETTGPECRRIVTQVAETRADTTVLTTGLRYIEAAPGSGAEARLCADVQVNYTGLLTDGSEFDASGDTPIEFGLGIDFVIAGFEQGILGMREGGQRRLIIPPHLGYGSATIRNHQTGEIKIPPNSTLIFDIELVRVRR